MIANKGSKTKAKAYCEKGTGRKRDCGLKIRDDSEERILDDEIQSRGLYVYVQIQLMEWGRKDRGTEKGKRRTTEISEINAGKSRFFESDVIE